jgi:hypothetical protein
MDKVLYAGREYAIIKNSYIEGMERASVGRLCALRVKELANGMAFIEGSIWYKQAFSDITPAGSSSVQVFFPSHEEALARSEEMIRSSYPGALIVSYGLRMH